MKKVLIPLLAFVNLAVLAVPLTYEGFDYTITPTSTNLVGHATPEGLTWDQAGPTTGGTNVPAVVAGSLSYSGLAPSTGNSAHLGGVDSGGMAARLSLKSSVSSGTLFFSCIIKITDITSLSTGGVFWAGFNNTAGSQSTLPTAVGARIYTRASGGGFNLGVAKNSSTASDWIWDSTVRNVNNVIFVVGSYTIVGSVASDDICQLWINPDPSTFGATNPPTTGVVLTATTGADITSGVINSFCLFNRNVGEPHGIILDELTIGTTWADVTPTASSMSITAQPKDQRVVVGNRATFSVSTYRAPLYQWLHNDANIPDATNASYTVTNAQLSDAGSYRVVVGNGLVSSNSTSATLTVYADTYPRLAPLWSVAPLSRPYMSVDGSTTPNQRCIAYNALSNQVLVVSRTNITVNYPTNAAIYVLDANTGNDLYQMNADPNTIQGGYDINGGGTNLITLNALDVADDGAVYGANVGTGSTSANWLRVYRWDNSGPAAAPGQVWQTDPTGLNTLRWGDAMAVRGAGNNTQVLLDDSTGTWGAILTNNPTAGYWQAAYFTNAAGGQTAGRTLLFYGSGNTFWEKHGGNGLTLLSYDLAGHTSNILTNFANLSASPNLVAFNSTTNLLCGINRSLTGVPDTLDFYDISDPTQPLYLASYNFPAIHNLNGNGCGRVIFVGDKVFALDSNNGLMALTVVPRLTLTAAGSNLLLSWPASFTGYTLQATPSITPPVTWTNVSPGTLVGSQYFVTNAPAGAGLFYRLEK